MNELPPVDWDLTASMGGRFAPLGPRLSRQEKIDVIASLHQISARAHHHAVEVSQLPDPGEVIGVQVLGRAAWVQANLDSVQAMFGDALDQRRREDLPLGQKVGARATGLVSGLALGWIGTKIIGQFDPFAPEPVLYYVAPNVVMVERELQVPSDDFRFWVAVHEQTHRLQFHRAPWLKAELQRMIRAVVADQVVPMVGPPTGELAQATAIMSVLEGYAEVMMSAVGPDVIASVERIRTSFARRRNKGGFDAVARRLLGMDMKIAQYRDGANFCREVLAAADLATLNTVWEGPTTFPTLEELHDPRAWLARLGS